MWSSSNWRLDAGSYRCRWDGTARCSVDKSAGSADRRAELVPVPSAPAPASRVRWSPLPAPCTRTDHHVCVKNQRHHVADKCGTMTEPPTSLIWLTVWNFVSPILSLKSYGLIHVCRPRPLTNANINIANVNIKKNLKLQRTMSLRHAGICRKQTGRFANPLTWSVSEIDFVKVNI
jgi:hypothetical protein